MRATVNVAAVNGGGRKRSGRKRRRAKGGNRGRRGGSENEAWGNRGVSEVQETRGGEGRSLSFTDVR